MRQTFTNGKLGRSLTGADAKNQVGLARAEELAVEGLVFLSADEDRLLRFLDLSGLQVGDLRQAAGSPGFLGAVLAHILGDERLAAAFAAEKGLAAEALSRAREALSRERP